MLEVKGVTYFFSNHALDEMDKRNIPEEWIKRTIADPDSEPEYEEERDNHRYHKVFRQRNLVYRLRVVVDHKKNRIVTVMYVD